MIGWHYLIIFLVGEVVVFIGCGVVDQLRDNIKRRKGK